MLLGLGVTAMGEMVVETSPRQASTISTSSRVLTWDEVSPGMRCPPAWGDPSAYGLEV